MSPYKIALLTHVFATLVLFMAIGIEWLCLHRLRSSQTTEQLREWGSLTRVIAKPFPISSVLILVSGLYMVLAGWGWEVAWINLSLAALLVMGVVGPFVNSRRLDAIAAAARTLPPGPIPPDLARRIQDPVLLTSVQTLAALTFGVVYLMVARPDLLGSVATLVLAVAIGLLSGLWGIRRPSAKVAATKAASPRVGH